MRLDPNKVHIWLEGTELRYRTDLEFFTDVTLWEIMLLRIISICYFGARYTFTAADQELAYQHAFGRAKALAEIGMHFSGMTTRRPPNAEVEMAAIAGHIDGGGDFCLGTSNIAAAAKYGVQPNGTMGHKMNMVLNGLHGIVYGTIRLIEIWTAAFNGDNGTALTDTICTPFFYKYCFGHQATFTFSGVRNDSCDPFVYCAMTREHYRRHGIPTKGRRIVHSNFADNSDTIPILRALNREYGKDFWLSMGAGQFFMPFPEGMMGLNIVMKAVEAQLVDQPYEFAPVPLVKRSDAPGKAVGDRGVLQAIETELKTYGIVA